MLHSSLKMSTDSGISIYFCQSQQAVGFQHRWRSMFHKAALAPKTKDTTASKSKSSPCLANDLQTQWIWGHHRVRATGKERAVPEGCQWIYSLCVWPKEESSNKLKIVFLRRTEEITLTGKEKEEHFRCRAAAPLGPKEANWSRGLLLSMSRKLRGEHISHLQ